MITWAQVRERYRRVGRAPHGSGRRSESPTDEQLLRLIEDGARAMAEVDDLLGSLEDAESERDEAFRDLERVEEEHDEIREQLEAARLELDRVKAELERERDAGEREAIQTEHFRTAWDHLLADGVLS